MEIAVAYQSIFTKTIEKSNKPLVGLEYVIEFDECDKILRPFYCALCDVYCDERSLLFNLTSHEHRISYLKQNFPSIMTILDANKKFNHDSNYRENILTRISEKLQIYLKIPKVKQYSLKTFESFKNSITKSIKTISAEFSEKSFKNPNILLEGINPDEDISSCSPFCGIMEISNSSLKSRLKKYYEKLDVIEGKVHEAYNNYREKPESHPKYVEEWEMFYNRRYPDLEIMKIENSNLKREWIQFWIVRMEELHYEDISRHETELREELNLTRDVIRRNEEEKLDKIVGKSKTQNRHLDDSDSDKYLESCIRDPRIPRRKRRERCMIEKLHSMSNQEVVDPKRYEYDAPGSVFTICRQILAIKDEMDIFESAVRKLYMKSAAMEKKKFYSSEVLLMDEENFRLFETVRNKLRNAIDKKLLEDSKVRCAQRTAQLMNGMIFDTEFRKKKLMKEMHDDKKKTKRGFYSARCSKTLESDKEANKSDGSNEVELKRTRFSNGETEKDLV